MAYNISDDEQEVTSKFNPPGSSFHNPIIISDDEDDGYADCHPRLDDCPDARNLNWMDYVADWSRSMDIVEREIEKYLGKKKIKIEEQDLERSKSPIRNLSCNEYASMLLESIASLERTMAANIEQDEQMARRSPPPF